MFRFEHVSFREGILGTFYHGRQTPFLFGMVEFGTFHFLSNHENLF